MADLDRPGHVYDAEVSLRLVAVRFDALDPEALGVFWAGMLGREIVEEANGVLLPGTDTQIGLRFVAATTETSGRNRLHLHLTSSTAEDQRRKVETVLRLGGRRFGTKPLPMGRDSIFLADPGSNEFCVIEPGNSYLAGCGLLGEFTCDGTREVGLFWRDALEWPLVWNQGKQIAIQSRRGGTKISWELARSQQEREKPARIRPRCTGTRCRGRTTGRPGCDGSGRPRRRRWNGRSRRERVFDHARPLTCSGRRYQTQRCLSGLIQRTT